MNRRATPQHQTTLPEIYRVRHHYRYVYSGSVYDVKQRLIMIPPNHHLDQELVAYDLDVRGPTGHVSIDWRAQAQNETSIAVDPNNPQHVLACPFDKERACERSAHSPRGAIG